MKRRDREDDRGYYYDERGGFDGPAPPRFGRDAETRHGALRDPPRRDPPRRYSTPYDDPRRYDSESYDDRYHRDARYDGYDRRDRYGPPGYDGRDYERHRRRSPPRHHEYERYDYDRYYDDRYRAPERYHDDWDRAPASAPVQHRERSPQRESLPEVIKKPRADAASDWECPTCFARNFARRDACYKCTAPRDENAKVLAKEITETSTLWIKNIPEDATEEQLAHKISCALEGDISFIRSIKMPREYGTDKRRGFAFVNCSTPEHAMRVKSAIDNTPFRDDWIGGVMNCEFSLSEFSNIRAREDEKAIELKAVAQNAILQATAASAMTTSSVAARSDNDYVFDDATGYYKHKVTGIFYDPNSGLFYNAATSSWYSWNASTQEYAIVGAASVPGETRDEPRAKTKSGKTSVKASASRTVHATISSAPVVNKPPQSPVREHAHVPDSAKTTQYRDRASERRALHDKSVVASAVGGRVTGGRIRTPKAAP